jgi:hypothetical protein
VTTRRLADALTPLHAKLGIARSMEVDRVEYLDHMTFQANKRPLFTEIFGPLVGLKEEWRRQGATEAELDLSAFRYRRPAQGGVPVNAGGWMGATCEEAVLEDTQDHVIARDVRGRTLKVYKHSATLPLPLDYPVKTMEDWRRLRGHYAFSEDRFAPGWAETARDHLKAGRIVTAGIPGGFDEPRQLMGEEGVCMAYATQPELLRDMLETIGETAERVLERVASTVRLDALMVHEDMAGKNGPLAGPEQVREFILPYYRRCWETVRAQGARLFGQDSDGHMTPVLDAFLDCGLNMMFPMEPAAGMDIVKLRERYGQRLAFEGGLDKFALLRGKDAITAELEYKIPPLVASGGCVLGLDHRIPNGVPLENYRFYIRKAWEILDREAAKL